MEIDEGREREGRKRNKEDENGKEERESRKEGSAKCEKTREEDSYVNERYETRG